jgi:hypothetical protein
MVANVCYSMIRISNVQGRLAQLVERLVYTENVGGSSPSPPIRLGNHYCQGF